MKKTVIAIIAVAVLVLGAVFVIAQRAGNRGPGGHGMGRHGQMGIGMALRGLDLTDEQKAKIKEIVDANKETAGPVREAMKANREKLAAMTGEFDQAKVAELAKTQGDLMAQSIVARQRVKAQIFALLTDEQKAKAVEMREQMKGRFQERMKRRGPGPKTGDIE
jgi:protein CpxP